jgi:hypothetical protein
MQISKKERKEREGESKSYSVFGMKAGVNNPVHIEI